MEPFEAGRHGAREAAMAAGLETTLARALHVWVDGGAGRVRPAVLSGWEQTPHGLRGRVCIVYMTWRDAEGCWVSSLGRPELVEPGHIRPADTGAAPAAWR